MKKTGLLLALVAVAMSGCAVDATGTTAAPASEAKGGTVEKATTDQGTLLARVPLAEGSAVAFFEMAPGVIRVEETGSLTSRPNPQIASSSSFIDAFRMVSPNAEIPAALNDAMTRFKAAAAAPSAKLAAPTEQELSKIHPMNTGTQNWFQQNFCANNFTAYCNFSSTGAVGVPWSLANGYTEIFVDEPTNLSAAIMTDYLWNGSSFVADLVTSTGPGTWTSERWFNASAVYREAAVTGATGPGGVAPVGLATQVRNAYGSVYWAGQWTFSGGWFMNDKSVTITALNSPVGGTQETGGIVSTDGYGTFSAVMPVWCNTSSPITTFNFKIVGDNTGETVTVSSGGNQCWN